MERLLTPRETDQLLRYPRGRSIRLAKEGKLPAIVLPDGEYRFIEQDIESILHAQRVCGCEQVEGATA